MVRLVVRSGHLSPYSLAVQALPSALESVFESLLAQALPLQ